MERSAAMTSPNNAAPADQRLKGKLQSQSAILPSADALIDRVRSAHSAHRQGDLESSERIYREILETAPRNPDALHGLGTMLLQKGKPAEAVEYLEQAVASGKVPGQFYVNLAVALEQSGKVSKALKVLKCGVSQDRENALLHQSLGVFLHNRSREREALRSLQQAEKLDPALPRLQLMLGDTYARSGDEVRAVECYQYHVKENPNDLRVVSRLAFLLGRHGRNQEVLDLLLPLHEGGCEDPDVCNNIGSALILMGRLAEAEPYIMQAYELDPSRWEFNANVAGLYMANERLDAAVTLFERLKEQYPDNPQPATDLALAYLRLGRVDDALAEITEITEAHPEHDPAWVALGMLRMSQVKYRDAAEAFRKAIEANPINVHANSNLAIVSKSLNDLDEAAFHAHKTIHVPTYSPIYFSNAFQVFHATCDYEGIREMGDLRELIDHIPPSSLPGCVFDLMVHANDIESAHWVAGVNRRWGEVLEESAARNPLPPMPDRAPHEKVRVGFLSSDLRDHSVGKHIAPLLQAYDRERIDVYGYSAWDVDRDQVHQRLKQLMNGELRTVANLPAREIAEIIRADEIDILFELNGHTLGSRLDVIPYRAAPVQIEWLGFPFTTGLKDFDYFLLDQHVAPTDRSLMIEKPLMMPESWTIFGGQPEMPITERLPVEENGYITFGTLNSPYKLTPDTVAAWARVMTQVPNSRMIIVRADVKSRVLCANIANEFAKHGISADRIGFFDNRSQNISHHDCYNFIDMTMDTFPVTGGTTTCDAMWMGVPVVTLAGPSYHQRISHALLSHIGLQELSTTSVDEFVQRSVDLANDIDSLRFLRQHLRPALQESYLCDAPRYAKHFCDVMENVAREHGLA
jgi:protein O-GlcNAc transferase